MHKYLLCILLTLLSLAAIGQVQPVMPDTLEAPVDATAPVPHSITNLSLRAAIDKALPHTYKNWTLTTDTLFDRGLNSRSPFMVMHHLTFTVPRIDYEVIKRNALNAIENFLNFTEMAGYRKVIAGTKIEITIITNIGADTGVYPASFKLAYCSKTTPQPLELPFPVAFAFKSLQPGDCPIVKIQNLPAFDMDYSYADEGVVFIGSQVDLGFKRTSVLKNGVSEDRYKVTFDNGKPGNIKSMLVRIKGNSKAIDEMVELIDWPTLDAIVRQQ